MRGRLALPLALLLSLLACSAGPAPCEDPLADRALRDLASFTGWLDRHDVRGVVGEVGWPDDPQWQRVGAAWYASAVEAGVGTFAWAAAERWDPAYPLALYRGRAVGATALDLAGGQAEVVEQHDGEDGLPRGVALADGSFAASRDPGARFSSAEPGVYGTDYRYPSPASLAYLAGRGVRSVRLAFQWERVQPVLGGPLSTVEVDRLREVLDAADREGVEVVLDLHAFGRYVAGGPDGRRVLLLGSPELPAEALADVWRRLAGALGDAPALAGYGLVNEPHDLPGGAAGWERDSVVAVRALREVDPRTPVLLGGYRYSGARTFAEDHPRPWLPADLGPVLYEAHQYFDADGSGTYAASADRERELAREQGRGCRPS